MAGKSQSAQKGFSMRTGTWLKGDQPSFLVRLMAFDVGGNASKRVSGLHLLSSAPGRARAHPGGAGRRMGEFQRWVRTFERQPPPARPMTN